MNQSMNPFTGYPSAPYGSPSVQAVRKVGGSGIYLVAIILFSAAALLQIVNLFIPNTAFSSAMRQLIQYEPDLYSYVPAFQGFLSAMSLISFIPTLLAVAGYWVCFASAKNTKSPYLSTTGLSLLQAYTIIQLIVISLISALLIGIMALAAIMLSEYSYELYSSLYAGYYAPTSSITAAVYIVFLLIALCLAAYILYYAKAVSTISRIKQAAGGVMPFKKVSMYVIVMNFIFSFFSLITTLVSITSASGITTIANLLVIAFHICIAITLINMRTQLHNTSLYTANGAYNAYASPSYTAYSQSGSYQPTYQNQNPQQVNYQNQNPQQGLDPNSQQDPSQNTDFPNEP